MSTVDYKPKPFEQSCRKFTRREIIAATRNFDESLVVGRGGFGKVYKCVIDRGQTAVAIKWLDIVGSKQGPAEFGAEIEMLSSIRHCNVVTLIGYCHDGNEKALIYEYMARGTLADNIHGPAAEQFHLSWDQRVRILTEVAQALNYLHTGLGKEKRIIHRDIKSTNILLDEDWAAKVSDLGISKFGPRNQPDSHVITRVMGTFGYMDPDYCITSRLRKETDVFALGVVLFEVLCGKPAVYPDETTSEKVALQIKALQWCKEGILDRHIDPRLRGEISEASLIEFAGIAVKCLHGTPQKRPSMVEVVVALDNTLKKNQDKTSTEIMPQLSMSMISGISQDSYYSTAVANSDSDDYWEQKLPSGYQEILELWDSPIVYSTKKQLYELLSKRYVLLKGGKLSFKIDESTGKNCYMVSAQDLQIEHGKKKKHWSYPNHPESRFAKVAKLLIVYWLDIRGKIETRLLSPRTTYAAYMVYKVFPKSDGLYYRRPISTSIMFAGNDESCINSIVCLKESDILPEKKRNDGWTEIKIGEIFITNGSEGEVEILIEQINTDLGISGLILEGIEFRPRN